MKKRRFFGSSLLGIGLLLLGVLPFGESAFVTGGEVNTSISASQVESTDQGKAVCYIGSTYYTDVGRALKDASDNSGADTIYMIPNLSQHKETGTWAKTQTFLGTDYATLNETSGYYEYTLSSNDSLVLPIDTSNTIDSQSGTSSDPYADRSHQSNCMAEIVVESSVKLIIDGNLQIGGVWGSASYSNTIQGATSGHYSQISLMQGSKLEINGSAEVYGFIKEYDEDNKSDGIEINGSLAAPIAFYDARGGTYTMNVCDTIFPYNMFEFPNLQPYTKVNYEGSITLKLDIYVYGHNKGDLPFLSNSSSSLFQLTSQDGCFTYDYTPTSTTTLTTNGVKRKVGFTVVDTGYAVKATTKIEVYGDAKLNNITVNAGTTMSTSGVFLPFSYKLDIHQMTGTFTIPSGMAIKFMPGSKYTLHEGATANIDGDVIAYETFDESVKTGNDCPDYPTNLSPAKITVNGTANINGSFGGNLYTENENGTASVNFSSGSTYSCSSPEVTDSGGDSFADYTYRAKGDVYYGGNYISGAVLEKKGTSFPSTKINENVPGTETPYQAGYWMGSWNEDSNYFVKVAFDSETNGADSSKETSFVISYEDNTTLEVVGNADTGFEVPKGQSFTIESLNDQLDYLLIGNTQYGEGDSYTPTGNIEATAVISLLYSLTITTTSASVSVFINGSTTAVTSSGTIKSGATFTVSVTYENTGENASNSTTITIGGESKTYSASTTYTATGNVVITASSSGCFAEGTSILMEDGSSKAIEDISSEETIMSFDHETGRYVPARISGIIDHGESEYNVLTLRFDDGKEIEIIGGHGFMEMGSRKYVTIHEGNVEEYLGKEFASYEDGELSTSALTSYANEARKIRSYSVITVTNLNAVAEGLLTIGPNILDHGFANYFELDEDLSYNEEAKARDIETYGLYTYEYASSWVPSYELFMAMNGPYMKVSVGKGLTTEEKIIELINLFLELSGSGVIT